MSSIIQPARPKNWSGLVPRTPGPALPGGLPHHMASSNSASSRTPKPVAEFFA